MLVIPHTEARVRELKDREGRTTCGKIYTMPEGGLGARYIATYIPSGSPYEIVIWAGQYVSEADMFLRKMAKALPANQIEIVSVFTENKIKDS